MRENTDLKKSEYKHISRSAIYYLGDKKYSHLLTPLTEFYRTEKKK